MDIYAILIGPGRPPHHRYCPNQHNMQLVLPPRYCQYHVGVSIFYQYHVGVSIYRQYYVDVSIFCQYHDGVSIFCQYGVDDSITSMYVSRENRTRGICCVRRMMILKAKIRDVDDDDGTC